MNKEIVYLQRNNKVVREILVNGVRPVEPPDTITRVGLIVKRGSHIQQFFSDDDPAYVSLPNNNWQIEISLGNANIPADRYTASIILFDEVSTNGTLVKPFVLKVCNG